MAITLFSSLTEKDKNNAIQQLISDSTPRHDFFFMSVLSILMATFGLLINSVSVVIGSMLITPLLSPVLSISLGMVISDPGLILRSIFTVTKSLALSIPAAAVVTLLFAFSKPVNGFLNGSIIVSMEPSIVYAAIALVSGIAASYAMIKPQLNAALPGVAISVALIPPLAATGIGLAQLNPSVTANSFLLFLINAICIVFASLMVFSLMNLYIKRSLIKKVVRKEDKKLEVEKAKAIKANGK
jgi:uncharacterized hydrophobic protein (TIGR00271 family)